jgi:hypothetical protein
MARTKSQHQVAELVADTTPPPLGPGTVTPSTTCAVAWSAVCYHLQAEHSTEEMTRPLAGKAAALDILVPGRTIFLHSIPFKTPCLL